MRNPIKHILCCVLALTLMLSVSLPVLADGESISVASNTVTLRSDTGGEIEIVSYLAETDGILTVTMAAADPGWAFRVNYSNGGGTRLITGKTVATYEYELTVGTSCDVELYAYDKAMWSFGDGEISYNITFTPKKLEQEVVTKEYVVSDTALAVGKNTVTAAPNAETTIFAFTPAETGTYRFTAGDSAALLGYWGSTANYLNSPGTDLTNCLEWTVTSVGQSVMLGLSGVAGCAITIEKTADYQETVIPVVVYENKHVFGTYTYDENAIVDIDIFDSLADVAVVAEDGFYHYGSVYGPVMVTNLKTIGLDINSAYTYRKLTAYSTDENGVTVKNDYNDAMLAYYKQGLYPVTEELGMMLREVGLAHGWFAPGGFLYPYASEVNEEIAWMGACSYVRGTETVAPLTLTLSYPTLAFEDEIFYNVYFTASDISAVVEMGLVTFADRNEDGTVADALEIIPGYVSNADGSHTARSNGVPAKMLGDTIYFKVYAKLSDGTYIYSDVVGYHAVAYANTVLGGNSSAEAKALVVAMLNYGAAAQVSFDYKTDALMNANLTADQLALVEAYSDTMVTDVAKPSAIKMGSFVMNGGYTDIHPTVSFEGAFSINYYFTPANTPDNSTVTFYYWDAASYGKVGVLTTGNATGTVKIPVNDSCTAAIEGIAAKQIDDAFYVAAVYTAGGTSYPTGVIGYSLGAYCKSLAAKGDTIGAATAVYGYYAKAYFA